MRNKKLIWLLIFILILGATIFLFIDNRPPNKTSYKDPCYQPYTTYTKSKEELEIEQILKEFDPKIVAPHMTTLYASDLPGKDKKNLLQVIKRMQRIKESDYCAGFITKVLYSYTPDKKYDFETYEKYRRLDKFYYIKHNDDNYPARYEEYLIWKINQNHILALMDYNFIKDHEYDYDYIIFERDESTWYPGISFHYRDYVIPRLVD
jgi:hypothetical protein